MCWPCRKPSSSSVVAIDQSPIPPPSRPEKTHKEDYTPPSIPTQFIHKKETLELKDATGMGKEFRRAASLPVGTALNAKLPNRTERKANGNKKGFFGGGKPKGGAKPAKLHPHNIEEIKRKYGAGNDANTTHLAAKTHDKLRERGEKLSALQRRTAELEADASNFSSLADELARKMEGRKWYNNI